MSSDRLPGKSLINLVDRPMIKWVVDRVSQSTSVRKIVIATSIDRSDNELVDYCRNNNFCCYRGPLNNVASRLSGAVSTFQGHEFIRISGDSPLIDPMIVDCAVKLYQATKVDLVTNVLERSFPMGQSVEIIRTATFKPLCETMTDDKDQEHVTQKYYRCRERFKIAQFSSGINASTQNMSVNTIEDLDRVSRLIHESGGKPGGWMELLSQLENLDT